MTAFLTVRDRVNQTLLAEPWSLVPAQRVDFSAWLCGLDEGDARSLLDLNVGEAQSVLERLENCADAAALKEEWIGARHAMRNQRTVEELERQACEWLR